MTRYRMDDGSVVDTDLRSHYWDESEYYATGSQWNHQRLYRSRKGRYYLEHSSQREGSRDHVEWISREEAARWMCAMGHDIPDDLSDLIEDILE